MSRTTNDKWPQEMPTFEMYDNLEPFGTYKNQFNLVGDKVIEIKNVTVFTFTVGDVEDPDLYAGEPLFKWQESEMGKWVLEHAVEVPVWNRIVDPTSLSYRYIIRAKLKAPDLTFFYLKWQHLIDKPIR